jgi:transcriptional regulator GlxA family with amidase domain
MTTRNVSILIFDEVEVLDFCGPFEVFAVTGREMQSVPFKVSLVAERLAPVLARGGLSVNPHYDLTNCPAADVLVVPGGWGTRREMHNQGLIDWIRASQQRAEIVLSVCTGALLLGTAGLVDGLDVTTHWGAIELLQQTVPAARVHERRKYIDNGRIVTSAGISAGIDASLHVVARLLGEGTARDTARYMEYDWQPLAPASV